MLSESIKRGRRKLILELVKLNLEIIFLSCSVSDRAVECDLE